MFRMFAPDRLGRLTANIQFAHRSAGGAPPRPISGGPYPDTRFSGERFQWSTTEVASAVSLAAAPAIPAASLRTAQAATGDRPVNDRRHRARRVPTVRAGPSPTASPTRRLSERV